MWRKMYKETAEAGKQFTSEALKFNQVLAANWLPHMILFSLLALLIRLKNVSLSFSDGEGWENKTKVEPKAECFN